MIEIIENNVTLIFSVDIPDWNRKAEWKEARREKYQTLMTELILSANTSNEEHHKQDEEEYLLLKYLFLLDALDAC